MKLPAETVKQLRTFYQGQKVCVTGAAGFIGGHLCDALLSLGADVRCIDDLSNSSADHLAELIELEPDRIRFFHGSILDDDALGTAVGSGTSGCGTIFHLAAIGSVPRSVEQPQRTWSVNATGTLRVLEAARHSGSVQRVVSVSSSSVYGNDPALPKIETAPLRPLSPYAASKAAGEHLLASFAACYALSSVALRFFNVFGPRQPAGGAYAAVIPAFTKALLDGQAPVIYGDGTQTRDFTYVGNAVLALLLSGASAHALAGQPINIGAGRQTSLTELATLLAARCETFTPPTFQPQRTGDVLHSYADIAAAKALIGYEPVTTLETGLAETVDWFKQTMAPSKQ